MIRFFLSLYAYFFRRRKLLALSLALFTGLFVASLFSLEYKEDVAEFLPDNEANERINVFYRHIGSSNQLLVFFSMKDSTLSDKDRIIEAINDFALLLAERDTSEMTSSVALQQDDSGMLEMTAFIRDNAPYFLTEADYSRMDSLLESETFVARQLKENKQLLMLPSGAMMRETLVSDPLRLFTPLLAQLQGFSAGDGNELYDGYMFMSGGRKGVVVISTPYGASESKKNTELLNMLNGTIDEVSAQYPDMRISCLGTPAIAVSNANRIKQDSLISSALAVLLILILLVYFFRNARNIVLIFIPVLFGWLFAMAMLSFFMDSVSIIVIGISSIVIGIAVNYPLHLVDHIKHERNIRQALKDIIPPLVIGNITTVGAFLSLAFINSSAMRNLGLFGALLLIGTILFVLLYLPHFVKTGERAKEHRTPLFDRLSSFAPETKKWILWPVLLLTLVFGWLSQYTRFESDANKINYLTPAQQEDMQDTYASIEREGRDIVYAVTEGGSLDEALKVYEGNKFLIDSLQKAGLVESISGVGNFLVSKDEQKRRIELWNSFWNTRREALLQQIEERGKEEGFRSGSFARFAEIINADYQCRDEEYFAPVTKLLAGRYLLKDADRHMIVTLLYCEKDSSSAILEALQQTPPETFAFDSRNVLERMVDSLSGDFNYVLYVCGFIVFVFLIISFGRIELSLLAFIPLTVSWIWILGLMQIGGMSFNIVNIILATFIFGQGDDYTIFITEGLIHEYTYRKKMLASYKNSIIISAMIMFIGIGMLIFARHPALRSLAEVTIVGMFSVVLMAYLIPPLLFKALTKSGDNTYREIPVTARRFFNSIYTFMIFLAGSAFITLFGLLLPGLKKNERRKLIYHTLIYKTIIHTARLVPGAKLKYENLSGETFERPSVIVSNHQSHLDLVCLLTLYPKLIVLTNDRVWNNPYYGRLIKYADFYPSSKGMDAILGELSERIANGYSIVVFPEGTRSEDCSILRFHKGAFYLAEALKLDIVPVLVHGAGHVLPKKDFMLRKGEITVQIHERIKAGSLPYAELSKQTRQYYVKEYKALSERKETTAYFKYFVYHNYIYKGMEIEYSVRRELKKNNCYSQWIDGLKLDGSALVVNGGYGVFAFLLALTHREAEITAVEHDADKAAIAANCAGLPSNLHICNENPPLPNNSYSAIFLINPDENQRQTYSGENVYIVE